MRKCSFNIFQAQNYDFVVGGLKYYLLDKSENIVKTILGGIIILGNTQIFSDNINDSFVLSIQKPKAKVAKWNSAIINFPIETLYTYHSNCNYRLPSNFEF